MNKTYKERKKSKKWLANHIANNKAYRQSRKDWLDELRSIPCKDCKKKFPVCCMDFDHVPNRGIKKFNIMRYPTYSKEKLLKEIKKCDVVCSNCHRIRTEKRLKT